MRRPRHMRNAISEHRWKPIDRNYSSAQISTRYTHCINLLAALKNRQLNRRLRCMPAWRSVQTTKSDDRARHHPGVLSVCCLAPTLPSTSIDAHTRREGAGGLLQRHPLRNRSDCRTVISGSARIPIASIRWGPERTLGAACGQLLPSSESSSAVVACDGHLRNGTWKALQVQGRKRLSTRACRTGR